MLKLPLKNAQGFTLIELMVAIALLGILVALALPNYRAFMQNSRIRNAAESIQNGIQIARSEAVKRNADVQFVLQDDSSWDVGCVNVSAECPASIQSRSSGDGSSSAIIITASNGDTVVFGSLGRMTTPALVAPATSIRFDVDIDTAVLPAAESRELRIIVGVGGDTRMCDPTLPATDTRAC